MKRILLVVLPLALLAALVAFVLKAGIPSRLTPPRPPVERVAVRRFELTPDWITVHVLNDGPDPVTIAQVLVNEAYWSFSIQPQATLGRLQSARLSIPYPWIPGEPLAVTLVTRNGVTIHTGVEAAAERPRPDPGYFGALGLIGVYIGVLPVFLGILWLPFLRRLKGPGFQFLLALTLGLLFFLGVDSLLEAIEAVADTPRSLLGSGILLLGFTAAFLLVFAFGIAGRRGGRGGGTAPKGRQLDDAGDEARRRSSIAYAIAFGIGVHNLGEGLAIGGAYAVGNVTLGALLVAGFMIHNLTEGVAIVAPISRVPVPVRRLIALGLLAGAPAILGAWLGGFAFSALWAVLVLAVGAGAIFQVFVEILGQMGRLEVLLSLRNSLGFLAGVAVMYATGLLVTA